MDKIKKIPKKELAFAFVIVLLFSVCHAVDAGLETDYIHKQAAKVARIEQQKQTAMEDALTKIDALEAKLGADGQPFDKTAAQKDLRAIRSAVEKMAVQ